MCSSVYRRWFASVRDTASRATHQADRQVNELLTDENLDRVAALERVAEALGITVSVLALSWILRKGVISSVITGASRPSQLESNLAAAGLRIPEDALEEIDRILGFVPFERHVE